MLPIIILFTLFSLTYSQDVGETALCYSLQGDNYTCAKCINFHPSCAWCSDKSFNIQHSRCDTADRLLSNNCGEIENPRSGKEVLEEKPLTATTDAVPEDEDVVQLTPQKIRINIRPKDTVYFDIHMKQALDYPVDLYYLMDLSYSMADDKQKLTELGDKLAARMQEITKNFRLGFGSFVDKKVMPFVDPRTDKANRPCDFCVEPYGFKHQMTLTTDTNKFAHEVNASSVSGNLDAPEGSFDAIIQALSCNKEIGWRPKSRRMLVVSTDAGFHYAGDGRLGGLVIPNDGECHLDSRNFYDKSTEFDYPSIGQLHKKIRDSQANVIFAVTQEQAPLYERLQSALPDISSTVGILADDSSNIVKLIETEYNKISEKVIMVDNVNTSQGLNITYASRCLDGQLKARSHCDGIKVGDNVTFTVGLRLERCTEQKQFDITIQRSGLDEIVQVEVNVLCDCECEKNREPMSELCSHKGTLVCGICECDEGHVGRKCECLSSGVSTAQMDLLCRKNNDSIQPICSGRGFCSCGVCECEKRPYPSEWFFGPYCECDNFNCPRRNRELCSNHGVCNCSKCDCNPGWIGPACECPASNAECIAPNGKICNNQGDCVCGVCKCYKGSRYHGKTCEQCATCPKKCDELRPCVMCKGFKTGPYNETTCNQCPYIYHIVKDHKEWGLNQTFHDCQFQDPADDCTFYFRYVYDEFVNDTIQVWIREKKDCPPAIPILAIVLGVIAGIVLIGLVLLLLWKLLTIIHDRREYAKFEKERLMARWDTGENPIFHPATTTFKNPAYGGK